ncbi:hypothetical protein, partial [Mesorhizobium sp.]|uniref:hypothetical protein n=1 Tax=Mesorhizobium sp. TaxID=1871066 RepID=UPI0025E570E0
MGAVTAHLLKDGIGDGRDKVRRDIDARPPSLLSLSQDEGASENFNSVENSSSERSEIRDAGQSRTDSSAAG